MQEEKTLASLLSANAQSKILNFSVETVRNLLNIDNKEIAKLCAQVSLMPKKDSKGRTYFTKDDIEILRRVKTMNERVKSRKNVQKSYATVPMSKKSSQQNIVQPQQIQAPMIKPEKSSMAVEKICTSLSAMENSLTGKLSEVIEKKLEEKLDGMDEIVVELVRCKTENETLRYKMNELNKEVYNLKNEISKYKSVGLGFYVKKSNDSSLI